MPYAIIAGVLLVLLVGAGIAVWKWGRAKADARAKDAEAALSLERKVADAVDEARRHPVTPDDLGLRDPGSGPPPS